MELQTCRGWVQAKGTKFVSNINTHAVKVDVNTDESD